MKYVKKGNLRDIDFQKIFIYNNGEIAFVNNLKDLEKTNQAIQLEIYVVLLLLEGKASVKINETRYELQKNDVMICTPNFIVENMLTSIDFKCCCICLASTYIQKISPMTENVWDIKFLFEKQPVYTLYPEEVTVFCQYYDLVCSKIHLPSPVQTKVIDTLMLAFLYDMQYVLNRMIKVTPRPFTSREYLFKQFVELLDNSYPKSRRVDYYAEQLHVTPKYLSAVCKNSSGETSSKLIDTYVLKDIEYLLKHTTKSIQEIAWELAFPSLSFFGKYVKQHFGMSPKAYREQALKNKEQSVKAFAASKTGNYELE